MSGGLGGSSQSDTDVDADKQLRALEKEAEACNAATGGPPTQSELDLAAKTSVRDLIAMLTVNSDPHPDGRLRFVHVAIDWFDPSCDYVDPGRWSADGGSTRPAPVPTGRTPIPGLARSRTHAAAVSVSQSDAGHTKSGDDDVAGPQSEPTDGRGSSVAAVPRSTEGSEGVSRPVPALLSNRLIALPPVKERAVAENEDSDDEEGADEKSPHDKASAGEETGKTAKTRTGGFFFRSPPVQDAATKKVAAMAALENPPSQGSDINIWNERRGEPSLDLVPLGDALTRDCDYPADDDQNDGPTWRDALKDRDHPVPLPLCLQTLISRGGDAGESLLCKDGNGVRCENPAFPDGQCAGPRKRVSSGADSNSEQESAQPALRDFSKQLQIYTAPDLLVLHCKRFKFNPRSGSLDKLHTPVDLRVDSWMDLSEYMTALAGPGSSDSLYSLCGVVEHLGATLERGHYIAYCWVEHSDPTDQEEAEHQMQSDVPHPQSSGAWYKFDDDSVSKVDLASPNSSELTVIQSGCYLLFWQKKHLSNSNVVAYQMPLVTM